MVLLLLQIRRGAASQVDVLGPPALLKLKSNTGTCAKKSRTVGSVCLPQQLLQPGLTCEIAGYGKEQHGEETSPLPI